MTTATTHDIKIIITPNSATPIKTSSQQMREIVRRGICPKCGTKLIVDRNPSTGTLALECGAWPGDGARHPAFIGLPDCSFRIAANFL